MTEEKKDELMQHALGINRVLRTATLNMTNEERVYFLEMVIAGATGARDMFQKGAKDER